MRKRVALGLLAIAAAGVATAGVVLYGGLYDVAATEQHFRPTFWLLETGLRGSVQRRARDVVVPELGSEAMVERGFRCFETHCAQCHGAPGRAPAEFAQGLLPLPTSLSQATQEWRVAELYWITKHGLKMTGMPAWGFRLDDAALWSIVAFLDRLPRLDAEAYRSLDATVPPAACERAPDDGRRPGDAARGEVAVLQYACTTCHLVPGVVGPAVYVGPPLTAMATRKYIAGSLPNTPDNMARWLTSPQAVRPATAMPDLGITAQDARDIAAYLAELR